MRWVGFALCGIMLAQQAQNPSPMVEHTRPHPRLQKPAGELPGLHGKLSVGTLFVPAKIVGRNKLPLFVHFHGGGYVTELAAQRLGMAVISVQSGSGSGTYARQFAERALFGAMLREAAEKAGAEFAPVTLTAWSAGPGAVREILAVPEYYSRINGVILIDGMHTGYDGGKPGPQESKLERDHLEAFLMLAKGAVAGQKTFLVTHSEIFPGTFASTTETADWLLHELGLTRKAVLKQGPMGTQQLSEVKQGRLHLIGYAGNSAPDHVDQLHSIAEYLRLMR